MREWMMSSVEAETSIIEPDAFSVAVFRALATNNVVGIRGAISPFSAADFCLEAPIREDESIYGVPVDARLVENYFSTVVEIGNLLMNSVMNGEARVDYSYRVRKSDKAEHSLPHFDNNRATLKDLLKGRTQPGIRLVYQIGGPTTTAGINTIVDELVVNRTMQLGVGDAWVIPQDRFMGLPMLTASRDGQREIKFVRHPEHYANNPEERQLLIQDIRIPLGGYVDAPFVRNQDVVEQLGVSLNPREEREISGFSTKNKQKYNEAVQKLFLPYAQMQTR